MKLTAYSRAMARKPIALRPPIVLVACCGQKLPHAAAAGELYRSDLFLKSKAWAEKFGGAWAILSARYGIVDPGRVIEPYDETLAGKSRAELEAWGVRVRAQLFGGLPMVSSRPLVVLAGARYRGWLDGIEHSAPLAGMGIGEQKAWLKAQVAQGAAA
jgi:hypothetical protein